MVQTVVKTQTSRETKKVVNGSNTNTLLSIPASSPAETPDNVSFRSEDDEFLHKTPRISTVFAYAVLATIICLPIGALAIKNVYQMNLHLRDGRKTRARRHGKFASSLSNAAVVIGTLFWCIVILVLIIHLVILKKTEPVYGDY